ncbi:MAG: toll/interleukin-1 receptor domain-containing protein [Candidatus Thiosymbion ectosymbiont of Robbea hypermnestra]|nr:toll/interleukin-1 receptor domain-containing protein [Candidatus Thiosymbion ectosymbiont of Robbea hypermnestra]
MSEGTHPTVFVSYSYQDHERVEQLVDKLKGEGLDVWTDREIAPGQDWQEATETALDHASVFLLILSPNATASPWQNVELGMALRSAVGQSRQRVIPVLLPGTDRASLPHFLQQLNAVEFGPNNELQAVESIADVATRMAA